MTAARRYRIAAISGDGIGPEVVSQGLRVLRRAAELDGFTVAVDEFPFGAEHYLATGVSLPPDFLERARGYDALLLGAIGDPRIEVVRVAWSEPRASDVSEAQRARGSSTGFARRANA